ncbi:MAG TPA: cobaltochelatase subunit CobN [Chloroflexi bacterium]|nr:cobaltochelatase subunit CobN [Chloroflexota bacterium]
MEKPEPNERGFLFLTHADTDLLALAHASEGLPAGFPRVCAENLMALKDSGDVRRFLHEALPAAEVVVVRLLGGKASFAHGFQQLRRHCRDEGKALIVLSGTDVPDPELTAASTVPVPVIHDAYAYFHAGGSANLQQLLRFLSDHLLATGFGYDAPVEQPAHGLYHPRLGGLTSLEAWLAQADRSKPAVGILFYRSHWMSGNTGFIDALVAAVEERGANALPVFTNSLKELQVRRFQVEGSPPQPATFQPIQWPAAFEFFVDPTTGENLLDVLISTLSFAMGSVNPDGPTLSDWSVEAFRALDVPVLQAIASGARQATWSASGRGLNPLDTAMNVALPEFDGRIITVPVSFKGGMAPQNKSGSNGMDPATSSMQVTRYVPVPERVDRLIGLALRFCALRRKPNGAKRVAFILTNSPGKAARIGNAVGLDAPASLMRLFAAMQAAGYRIEKLPPNGDALIHTLIERCSYDTDLLTDRQLVQAAGKVDDATYRRWHAGLTAKQRAQMDGQWGAAPGTAFHHEGHLAFAGLELGNVFVALQPPRGYGMDPNAIYHTPDLPPPHHYHALYRWLSTGQAEGGWGADAIVHVGKHGTLEWLPGKAVGLSQDCYPDTFLADMPFFYPFILNNPGEGAQAKRRTHAVIVDHLIPPMTSADLYGELAELAQLVDEYYQLEATDPTKLPLLQQQIWKLIQKSRLDEEIKHFMHEDHGDHTHGWDDEVTEDGTPVALTEMRGKDFSHLMEDIDGYLCELQGAQIRDGLHILGCAPEGAMLIDLLQALTRLPNLDVPGLREGVAGLFGFTLDTLFAEPGRRLSEVERLQVPKVEVGHGPIVTAADAIEAIDRRCHALLASLQARDFDAAGVDDAIRTVLGDAGATSSACKLQRTLTFVCRHLVPAIRRTDDEITNLVRALDGRYIPAGPSGAPTRGMAHVLPTGRNFYTVDPRALPSQTAWHVGERLAAELLERYLAEEGAYPDRVGLSIWGTSAMRTHGDDIAQIFALMGVRPVWQPANRRVTGVEVIPLAQLGHPRVDVVARISGFFRDAFPHLIELLDAAVRLVAELDEPTDRNFVRRHYLAALAQGIARGLNASDARRRSLYRVFGSRPGAYGAGILPLIDERNWQTQADFAEAYLNWGGYAYTAEEYGVDARSEFRAALSTVQVAAKNQDNREHDIFDSDDYLQYHGGMIASIRALTGRAPKAYFGDNADPDRVKVRDLKEEAARVFRSRVVNPKWIESIIRHGYKGALELAATVDYLFGYDATAGVLEDWMYEQVTEAYLLDEQMQAFFERSSPWAMQAITERLLEAVQRGLWSQPSPEMREALTDLYLHAEGLVEAKVTA